MTNIQTVDTKDGIQEVDLTPMKAIRLYEYYGTWRKVSDACDGVQPGSYWRQIAKEQVKNPSPQYVAILDKVYNELQRKLTRCKRRKFQRKNITVSTTLYKRLDTIRNEKSLTWNGLAEMMLKSMEGEWTQKSGETLLDLRENIKYQISEE